MRARTAAPDAPCPPDNHLNAMDLIWKPHVTVAALAERQGRFLLVEEDVDGRRVLNQPAGHLEDGESLLEAVQREVLEETGWRFEPRALVGVYRWRKARGGETFLRFTFSGAALAREPGRALDPEIEAVLWLDAAQVRSRGAQLRSPMVVRAIDDYLAGHAWPLALLADLG